MDKGFRVQGYPLLHTYYISYFFVDMIKHMMENNLRQREFILAHGSKGVRVHSGGAEAGPRPQAWRRGQGAMS